MYSFLIKLAHGFILVPLVLAFKKIGIFTYIKTPKSLYEILNHTNNNQLLSSELLGINRNTLRKKMADYEIEIVRKVVGKKMILVVPGIRPEKKSFTINDDQKRVLSPKDAVKFGANFLVIGRPITQSKNPLETIKNINQSIQ